MTYLNQSKLGNIKSAAHCRDLKVVPILCEQHFSPAFRDNYSMAFKPSTSTIAFNKGAPVISRACWKSSSCHIDFLGAQLKCHSPSSKSPVVNKSFKALRVKAVAEEEISDVEPQFTSQERVDILSEALPFIQRFQGKTVVVKYGGAAMKDPTLKEGVIKDLVLLSCVGMRPVLVHGGGPEINSWLQRIGIEPHFKDGLRVTDGPTMEVVEMVLVGKVNKSLVSLINIAGGSAVGMSGKDGKLITARQANPELGYVGDIESINITVLKGLVRDGHIPVIASVAADRYGQAYNVNADTAAGEIAASLGAEKLILMTDVPGVMIDPKDSET